MLRETPGPAGPIEEREEAIETLPWAKQIAEESPRVLPLAFYVYVLIMAGRWEDAARKAEILRAGGHLHDDEIWQLFGSAAVKVHRQV